MKKIKVVSLICAGVFLIALYAVAEIRDDIVGAQMSASQASVQWGKDLFDENRFRTGTESDRAKMAGDLLRKQPFSGQPLSDVKKRLGRYTGYFWNDVIPTYTLNEPKKPGDDVWQLVFVPNGDKVDKVIINKNCCDR